MRVNRLNRCVVVFTLTPICRIADEMKMEVDGYGADDNAGVSVAPLAVLCFSSCLLALVCRVMSHCVESS